MLHNIGSQAVTQSNNQISPRLMHQAHQKQVDSNYGVASMNSSETHQVQLGSLTMASQQQQSAVSITQNTGNLILQKGQTQAMAQIGIKDIWRDNSKNQKLQEQQKLQNMQSLAGINEFKQKVNIMLQNQMYLNVNSQNFTPGQQVTNMPNSKYESRQQRGFADLKQLNSMWPNDDLNQIQDTKVQLNAQGLGYGYVLGINDLRELKEMRAGISNIGGSTKTSHSHGEVANNVPVSSLYKKKQGRFDLQDSSLQFRDNGDQNDLKNILNHRNHSTRKASGQGEDELVGLQAMPNAARTTESQNQTNVQIGGIEKMNRLNQFEHKMKGGMMALSPTNYKDLQNTTKLQGGKKQSISISQHQTQPQSQEKKFHNNQLNCSDQRFSFKNTNNPQTRKTSQFQVNGQNPSEHMKLTNFANDQVISQGLNHNGLSNSHNYNTYSSNNQKQQQRRKLLFEYGLEKKLQNQGLQPIQSGSQSNQQQPVVNSQGGFNGYRQPLKSSNMPMYMGPGGPGPWVQNPNNLSEQNSVKHAYLRKGGAQASSFEQQHHQILVDCLANIEIEQLDQEEQDKLKFLSDQYQLALNQMQQYKSGPQTRESNLSYYSKTSHFNQNLKDDPHNDNSHAGKSQVKPRNHELKSEIYDSQERFKENEKHLSEVRLLKREKRDEEVTPGGSPTYVDKQTAGVIVNANSSQSSSRKQQRSSGVQQNSSKKSLGGSNGLSAIANQISQPNQSMSQVASDKKLFKNSSQTRFQIKSGQGHLQSNSKHVERTNDYGNIYSSELSNDLTSPNGLNGKRKRDLGGTMQPAMNDFISTDDSSFKNRGQDFGQKLSQLQDMSIFDQIKAQQLKRQQLIQAQQNSQQNPAPQYRLDISSGQKPPMTPPNALKKSKPAHPGLVVSDIKVMTSVQRINIFKLLQRREKSKFISIQQAKLQKLEGTFEVAAKKSARNQDGSEKTQNEKFLDIVRRQAFNTTGNTKGLPQNINYEQIRKQWVSDLKAFGVFQQNELWQFGQMTESQQRQILICNLQQGKFNGLFDENTQQGQSPNLQAPNMQVKSKPKVNEKSSIWQAAQRRNAYGSALGNVSVNGSIDKSSTNAFRNSLNVSSNRQKTGDFMGQDDVNAAQRLTQESPQKPLSQEKNSSISNRSRSISINDQKTESALQNDQCLSPPMALDNANNQTLDKTIDIQVRNINGNDARIVVGESGRGPTGFEDEGCQQTNYKFDSERKTTDDMDDYQQRQDQYTRNQQVEQHLESEQSLAGKNSGTEAHKAGIPNQIINKFEDSKTQFENCMKDIIQKIQNQNYQRNRHLKNMGLNNYLPNFPKHLINEKGINGQFNQVHIRPGRLDDPSKGNNTTIQNDKYRTKFKTEKEKQLAKLKLEKNESDPKAGNIPDSTKNKNNQKDGETENAENKDETIQEEVKKPRYFPPRKLPNPFESAAQEQERFIQARKDALAKYSNISKNRFKQDESAPYKYVLRPGNNSKLITKVLEKSGRLESKFGDDDTCAYPGWEPADDHYDSLYNFKWKPTSGGIKYDMIGKHGLKQLVNHVKGHGALTTKDNLFINLKAYYETQKMSIYDVVPLTIVLDYLNEDIGDKVESFLSIMRLIDKNIDQDVETINKKLHEAQIQKEKALKTPNKISNCCHGQQNLWMLKPTGFNRGIGIHIFQNFDQLRDIMCQHYGIGRGSKDKASIFQTHNHNHHRDKVPENSENQKQQMQNFTFVIQKLIEMPMLYMKRKFDIRQWVLFNSSDGRVYMFQEPYVRTSSKEYSGYDASLPNEDQIFMQLTNNAVQKDGEDYGKFEEGNIISIQTLFEKLKDEPSANNQTQQSLVLNSKKRMQEIIIDTMKAVKGKLQMQKHTFELLGYDFIFDEELNTILIEVNTNPCLEESNALLKRLLPRMIDDLLNITMDPLFGINGATENHTGVGPNGKYKSKFRLTGDVFGGPELGHAGYPDDKNLWEHIYTMETS